ncbi:PREDICTED: protein BTG1 [Aptenodytes forsteri]|uniref:protein BTG1 n=1 Tax=Aptenodytes forsteri TaxID=9233 RepID=UPI0004F45D81|nr:PREDICTED: protein BTG1 [Aptenodytes forsteri]
MAALAIPHICCGSTEKKGRLAPMERQEEGASCPEPGLLLCVEDPAWRPRCERGLKATVNKCEDKAMLGTPGVRGTGAVPLGHPRGSEGRQKGKSHIASGGYGKHYKHHWFPEKPCKGSGYRCIRINHKMDPLIGQAAQRIGLSSQELFQLLPSELTLWVDPYEVSYRIGEDGSICVLYEAAPAGGSQNNTNMQMVDSRISCKEELLLGRTSPSKSYNMMTVSG